ncbi:MAG: DUF6717 family protein [Ferruginibacter sp.]
MVHTKRFYKEQGCWYIDLPDFLAAGLGTRANLLMIDGSDTLLDSLSNQRDEVTLRFSETIFDGFTHVAKRLQQGLNPDRLLTTGHAPVSYGMYYRMEQPHEHIFWLCPVTEYVFGGHYPDALYLTIAN